MKGGGGEAAKEMARQEGNKRKSEREENRKGKGKGKNEIKLKNERAGKEIK